MRRVAALLTGLVAGVVAAQAGEAPGRIVSINLCADQLALALADPGQIVALSAYAHDRGMNYLAEAAASYPAIAGAAETVYALKPDLVLSGTFSNPLTNRFVENRGIPILVLQPVDSFADMRAQIRTVAAAVGHADRGEALVGALDAAIARAGTQAGAGGRPLRAVSLSRRGWIAGGATLDTDVMAAAGVENVAASFGVPPGGGTVGLEALIGARLDALVLETESIVAEDQGTALLRHPALAALYPPARRLVIPGPLTLCGGPGVIAALDRLAAEVAALRR